MPVLHVLRPERVADLLHLSLRRVERHARFQASKRGVVVARAVRVFVEEPGGDPDVGGRGIAKAWRGDPDDLDRLSADFDRLAQRPRAVTEVLLRPAVTHDRDGGAVLVLIQKRPA